MGWGRGLILDTGTREKHSHWFRSFLRAGELVCLCLSSRSPLGSIFSSHIVSLPLALGRGLLILINDLGGRLVFWFSVFGFRFSVFGFWFLVFGFWFLVFAQCSCHAFESTHHLSLVPYIFMRDSVPVQARVLVMSVTTGCSCSLRRPQTRWRAQQKQRLNRSSARVGHRQLKKRRTC
jgi:hypothetical protein